MFFKRPVNINFITILAVVIFLAVCAVASGCAAFNISEGVNTVGNQFNDLRASTDDGWGIVITGFTGLTGVMLVIVCWTAAITLAVIAALLFIPLLTARLVYRSTGGRLLAYRIIMGVEYFFLSLFALLLLVMAVGNVLSAIILLPFSLIMIAIITVNMVNTYSDRIKRY
ncbi:MAG: hypothetical protein HDQ99_10230 [Lachnospiraceae bacterium]|nr:hypothetical protein [Lachnospiraceae bacterium]